MTTERSGQDAAAARLVPLRPTIPMRRSMAGPWLFAGGAAVLAFGLFAALDARRHETSAPHLSRRADGGAGFADPPPLTIPPAAPPPQPAASTPRMPEPLPPATSAAVAPPPRVTAPPVLPPPPPLPRAGAVLAASNPVSGARLGEPAMVFDQSAGEAPATATAAAGAAKGGAAASDETAVQATVIRGRSTTIVQGSLIAATLETPIDSTRAGFARAVVAVDARSFDGTRVLIPRGSRLIGEYTGDVQSGQKRVLVTWTRLIRPDGIAIRLGSPAADRLGQAGVPGQVNTHFLARFASAVLQTALTIGTNIASQPRNGSVIVGLPGQTSGAIGQVLSPGRDLRTTIRVQQGAPVTVFVARDLDFSGVTPRS